MITLVIPTRNNLKYVKCAYNSIRKYLPPSVEIILLDDASTDDTWEWIIYQACEDENLKIYKNDEPNRVGHCVLYDIGADMASNEIFGIFHADMIATPNYLNNILKHVTRGSIVSATRIEPPLHPPGPEKIVNNFGLEPEEFNYEEFIKYVNQEEEKNSNNITNGIFAPWVMYVEDFQKMGGHDKKVFAPMELEDSDLFNRFSLNNYKLIQSRDSFVYHFTCRGSRFKDGINIIQKIPLNNNQIWNRVQDSEEYTQLRQIKFREWWRKWHMDVLHDQNLLPIVNPRYDTGFIVNSCPVELFPHIEPWCDTIYVDLNKDIINSYIEFEQKYSNFDLSKRIKSINAEKSNDILIEFNGKKFTKNHFNIIKQIPLMIEDSGEIGIMEYDIFKFEIKQIKPLEKNLIHALDPWYLEKLK